MSKAIAWLLLSLMAFYKSSKNVLHRSKTIFFWQFNLKQSFQWNKLTCLPFQTVIKLNLIKFIRERNLGRCQLYMGWGHIAVYANLSVQFISLLKVRCILCSNPWDSLVFNRIHHNFLWHCHGWISKRTAFARYEKNERKKL